MHLNEEKLLAKGWSQTEIEHAKSIWSRAKTNRSSRHIFIERFTYWVLLILLLGGALAGAWVSIPFLIVLSQTGAIIALGVIGLLFGTLAHILIVDLEHLGVTHHVLISFVIPISAIVASLVIYNQVSLIARAAEVTLTHNPSILSAVFAVASLLPYIIMSLYKRGKSGS